MKQHCTFRNSLSFTENNIYFSLLVFTKKPKVLLLAHFYHSEKRISQLETTPQEQRSTHHTYEEQHFTFHNSLLPTRETFYILIML